MCDQGASAMPTYVVVYWAETATILPTWALLDKVHRAHIVQVLCCVTSRISTTYCGATNKPRVEEDVVRSPGARRDVVVEGGIP